MPAYQYQPAEVMDFSKGVTDDYMNGSPNAAYELFNFSIQQNGGLISRFGTALDSETDSQIPLGSSRVCTLVSYSNGDKLFAHASKKIYYRDPTNWASLLGPSGNNPFDSADANTFLAHTEWNRHLIITPDSWDKPVKVYKDNAGAYQLRTAGLPNLASSPTCTGGAGANSYVYAFFHSYEYTVEDQTFVDEGPTTLVEVPNINEPSASTVAITLIPTLANAAGDNYDTANITIQIYRTINGGTEFYRVGEVTNGTANYNDTMSDATLQDNESIYTTGGVPDNDQPPLSKFCHTVNGKTYYAYLKDGSEILPSQIRQSQKDDPDSVPASYNDELEDKITGLSSVNDVPIVGCQKHIYRIDGEFDLLGRGAMIHRRISDHAGCISHESMVQAEGGLFWFGNDGIYTTDANKVFKVTSHLTSRYKTYLATLAGKNRKIKGVYNEAERCIFWTISIEEKSPGDEECDALWVLDLSKGISSEMTCYFWRGGDSFFPTAVAYHNGVLYRGDKLGYVLYFSEDELNDPKIDVAAAVADWSEETIRWKYTSVASNFGSSFARKIANKVLFSCKNETNLSLAVTAINDDGKLERPFTPIRWRRNFVWGDEEFVWGDPNFRWAYGGTIEVDRRFPSGGLRFNYLQLRFENDFSNITNSDLKGTVTVDSVAATANLDSVGKVFASNSVDYYMYLEHDGYTEGYKILSVSTDTVTLEDTNGTLVSGTWEWQIKGYRKSERINLIGYSISWAFTSRSHDTYNSGEIGSLE